MKLESIPILKHFFYAERNGAPTAKISEGERELLELGPLAPDAALARLTTSERGLDPADAEERLRKYGPNEAAREKKLGFVGEILSRTRSPLVVQLLVIGGLFVYMAVRSNMRGESAADNWGAAITVGVMILLSVFLAYFQEARSSKAAEKLRAMVKTTSIAVRSGKETELPMSDLVPGDLVVLAAGSIIPADLRLTSAKDFFVSQSALTGESMPVEKSAAVVASAGKAALDLPNAAFQGSTVVSGSARGLVVATGQRTYFGSISQKLAGARIQTSFDKGVNAFTWLMIRFMIVMVLAVFLIVGFRDRHKESGWIEALLFALAVAVGLTPEMLPMIVTVNLSKGALAMSRKKAIVKRLNSIQNFGAMDILCTDKTGTLTQDRVVLERYVDVTNRQSEDVLRYAYMNSHYQTGLRNLLDRAVLAHGDLDVERSCRKVDEIPFDFTRRRMSVVIDYEGDHVLICKGAVEEIFKACGNYQIDDDIHPLIDVIKNDIREEYESLSEQGYRVLAVAYREFPRTKEVFSAGDEADLTLLGYIAFFDPPKETADEALKALVRAGVRPKILTGDNPLVTQKVCRDVGLKIEGMVTGDQLVGLTDVQFAALAEKTTVFAKLSPAQKEQIIRALQRAGHVVGFLGDGINDAPALKAADVGISVDTAVDVAKESADIILLEKSLLVLEEGVLEGRKVFGNIIKYIKMGASSNFGNMFSMVGGSSFLPFLPMAPIQVLVNNLLYDFSQIGIPTDRVDDEYIRQPRKWNIGSIKKFMIYLGPVSSIFDYTTFFLLLYFFHCINWNHETTAEAKGAWENFFHTGWFIESILTQTLIVHVIRTSRIPFLQSRASLALTLTTVAVLAVAVYLPYSPLGPKLNLVPMPPVFWAFMLGTAMAYVALAHLVKTWFIRKFGTD